MQTHKSKGICRNLLDRDDPFGTNLLYDCNSCKDLPQLIFEFQLTQVFPNKCHYCFIMNFRLKIGHFNLTFDRNFDDSQWIAHFCFSTYWIYWLFIFCVYMIVTTIIWVFHVFSEISRYAKMFGMHIRLSKHWLKRVNACISKISLRLSWWALNFSFPKLFIMSIIQWKLCESISIGHWNYFTSAIAPERLQKRLYAMKQIYYCTFR